MFPIQILDNTDFRFLYSYLIKNDLAILTDIEKLDSNLPVFVPPKSLRNRELFNFILKNKNYILIDNGYWGNSDLKKKEWFRISVNSTHNFQVNQIPFSRKHLISWPARDWEITGKHKLVIIPNNRQILLSNISKESWVSQIEKTLRGEHVIWRNKPKIKRQFRTINFIEDLKKSNLVYSHVSVAAVESALFDIPIITCPECAAYPVSENAKSISKDVWLDHLAWSQFHIDEFADGSAWKYFFKYQLEIDL